MTYVIIGAGEAGVHAAMALRSHGYDGALLIIGDEAYLPYTRPPLSKTVLTSDSPALPEIRTSKELEQKEIELRLHTRASAVNPATRSVSLTNGADVEYDKLVIATGSRSRRLALPGAEHARIRYLRTFDEALALRAELRSGTRLVLIGGGYIGLEIAASATRRGCKVTVLESAGCLMMRVIGQQVSSFFRDLHESNGVDIRTGTTICGLAAHGDTIDVACADGAGFTADLVVAGIGADPCTELAQDAGLLVDNGIVVNEFGQSENPDIYACGDVANHPNPFLGRRVRLESWQNAQLQGSAVGAALAGQARPYAVVPWFWSDQFDVNLQMVGAPERWDEVVMRGDPSCKSFTAIYLERGVVVAANAVNRPKDIGPIRAAIGKRLTPESKLLADTAVPLARAFNGLTRRMEDVT